MKKIFIWSGRASDGASELSQAVGGKRVKVENSKYINKSSHILVNWGSSSIPFKVVSEVLNPPEAVAIAVNKLSTFRALSPTILPEWTQDRSVAATWLEKGGSVCVRQKLSGSSGEGLVVFGPDNFQDWGKLQTAPLYTRYIKKAAEYRVHVFRDTVIDLQQKRLRSDLPPDFKPNFQIQNLDNGFIFARENVKAPIPVLENAIAAVTGLGLTFGAVDVVWNEKRGLAAVLEVNTAPGLQGTTIESYATAIKEYANNV